MVFNRLLDLLQLLRRIVFELFHNSIVQAINFFLHTFRRFLISFTGLRYKKNQAKADSCQNRFDFQFLFKNPFKQCANIKLF